MIPQPSQVPASCSPRQRDWREWAAVVLICVVITLVIVQWVGSVTLYSPALEARRLLFHDLILGNRLPPGTTWDELGANSVNIRVLIVAIADTLARTTGLSVSHVYRLIDTTSLFATLLLAYAYMKRWFDPPYALTGLLLLSAFLPLTMMLHSFHPWDRPALLLWLVMILLLLSGRLASFALTYLAAIAVKYDAVVVPGLYWLLSIRRDAFWRPTAITAALMVAGFALYASLLLLFPGGVDAKDLAMQFGQNLADMRSTRIWHPALLVHGSLGCLCALGWARASREQRVLAAFGLLLLVPHFLLTNFIEVRAQMATALLMLPCAVRGLQVALGDHSNDGRSQ
jgi:hypothetical protein